MTATTDILPYATGDGANVLTQAAFAAEGNLTTGMSSGIVPSNYFNKLLRQSSFMAAGLANFCVSQGTSVPDDGNLTNLVSEIEAALTTFVGSIATTQTITRAATTGANHTYANGDAGELIGRSNSGTAMSDTLPSGGGALANGWYAYVKNEDATAQLTITCSGTINSGTSTPASFVIAPGEIWAIESQGSGTYNIWQVGGTAVFGNPVTGGFKNLKNNWASNTTLTLTADEIELADSSLNTKKIASWSRTLSSGTVGADGLDTGSIGASSWYYIYAILNPTTNTQGSLISLSATAPTMPSGYTMKALVGAVRTDGSNNFIGFIQNGREFQYQVGNNLSNNPPQLFSGAQGTLGSVWATISMASGAPTSICTKVKVTLSTTSGSTNYAIVAPNTNWSVSGTGICWVNGVTGDSKTVEFTPESANMYVQSEANSVGYMLGFTLNI